MSFEELRPLATANAHFVTRRLLIGGDLHSDDAIAGEQLDELVEAGVTHIIDLRLEWNDEDLVAERAPGISYLHHGVDDAGQRIPHSWFDTGVAFALDAFQDPGAIVLSHCHMGINRGPSLGFAILLATGWDPVEALDAIRRVRSIAYIAYAEDALDWHHARLGSAHKDRARDFDRVARWREENSVDVADVIRTIRLEPGV